MNTGTGRKFIFSLKVYTLKSVVFVFHYYHARRTVVVTFGRQILAAIIRTAVVRPRQQQDEKEEDDKDKNPHPPPIVVAVAVAPAARSGHGTEQGFFFFFHEKLLVSRFYPT